MDEEKVTTLFSLFVDEDGAAEDYAAVITISMQEVTQQLLEDADETDARLCYLAAAVALLRYTEITAARDRAACTFAGTIAQNTDASQKLSFAQALVSGYRSLCRSLLEDEFFSFQAI